MEEQENLWALGAETQDEDNLIEQLVVDIDGFEGPLDMLLMLARSQKVDLAKISILQLVEQYLSFIERVREMRIEVAADYLVMAAWLAFLKSKLLLPEPESDEEVSADELAAALAHRLKRLEAMRDVASKLMNRSRLGRDVFARGAPEPVTIIKQSQYSATLYDLLTAYAHQRQRTAVTHVSVKKRTVWSVAEARAMVEKLVGFSTTWERLDHFLIEYLVEPENRRTALASSFVASLEMVREGHALVKQEALFAPLYLKKGNGKPGEPDEINKGHSDG